MYLRESHGSALPRATAQPKRKRWPIWRPRISMRAKRNRCLDSNTILNSLDAEIDKRFRLKAGTAPLRAGWMRPARLLSEHGRECKRH